MPCLYARTDRCRCAGWQGLRRCLLMLLLVHSPVPAAASQLSQKEQGAWESLYDSMGVASSSRCAGNRANPCACRDIRCAGSSMEGLNIIWVGLKGTVPDMIGKLTNLRDLSLGHNDLSGTIPDTIGNLTSLQTLYLHDNQLSGTIPDTVGRLSNIQIIILPSNKLSGNQCLYM